MNVHVLLIRVDSPKSSCPMGIVRHVKCIRENKIRRHVELIYAKMMRGLWLMEYAAILGKFLLVEFVLSVLHTHIRTLI